MKHNPLDDIVKCTVEISSPASNDATFNTILMVVAPPPAAGDNPITKTFAVSKADELLDYGYTTSSPAYSAAEVAFSQSPAPDEVLVIVRGKTTTETETNWEDIKTTLDRADSEAKFYGIHLTEFKDAADIQAAMEWTEANERIFGFEYTDINACPIRNFIYYRTFGLFSGKADGFDASSQPGTNQYAALAWMAKCFGYDPGSETWALKSLAAIVPSSLSTAEKKALEDTNINRFLRYAGDNITIGGNMLSGEWIDVIRFRDWLKNEMQVNVFNVLKVNRKVPFTDAGIGLVEGAMKYTLEKGQEVGGIAPTQYDSDDNEIPGYTVSVPQSSDLTETERKSRKLTGCKYTARLAGAIHAVEIYGYSKTT